MVRCGWASFPVGILVRMVPAGLGGIEGKDCNPYGAAWPSGTSGAQGGWCSPYGAAWPKGPGGAEGGGVGTNVDFVLQNLRSPQRIWISPTGNPDPSSLCLSRVLARDITAMHIHQRISYIPILLLFILRSILRSIHPQTKHLNVTFK